MNTIVVQADSKSSKALIALFKAMNLTYEVKKSKSKEESPYNPEFVKKILEQSKSAKKGNVVKYTPELKQKWFGE